MSADTPSKAAFNLISEPWIPVVYRDGRQVELSLREVFDQADRVRRLVGDIPTQEFALTRLLLAILHDALDGPADIDQWAELWENNDPFARVPGYLNDHHARFDLLHPTTPFFQTPGLHTTDHEVFSLNRLVADVPNGAPLFTMRFPEVKRISFAEAARWLVHAHAYDISGIKTGVVGDPAVKKGKAYAQGVAWCGNLGGVLAEGRTLRETLLLNLIATDSLQERSGKDQPAWRRAPSTPGEAQDAAFRPVGVRDLYTWQSRRVLLHHDADGVFGVVLTYGDRLAPHLMQRREPMSGWRRSQAQERKHSLNLVYMPREHDPSRAVWRGLAALVAPRDEKTAKRGEPPSALRPELVQWLARLSTERVLPRAMLLRLRTFGMVYGTQQSLVDEVVTDAVDMAVVLLDETDRRLSQTAVDAVTDAEAAVTALEFLAADLITATGGEPRSRDAAKDAMRTRGFAALDGPYRAWLAEIHDGDDGPKLRARWQRAAREHVRRIARELLDDVGDAAWQGRLVEPLGGGKAVWLNDCRAEQSFYFRLDKALPLSTPVKPDEQSQPAEVPA